MLGNEGRRVDFCATELYCIGHFVNSNISNKKGQANRAMRRSYSAIENHYRCTIGAGLAGRNLSSFHRPALRIMMLAQSVAKGRNRKHNIGLFCIMSFFFLVATKCRISIYFCTSLRIIRVDVDRSCLDRRYSFENIFVSFFALCLHLLLLQTQSPPIGLLSAYGGASQMKCDCIVNRSRVALYEFWDYTTSILYSTYQASAPVCY